MFITVAATSSLRGKAITSILDWVWSIKLLKGYRTEISRAALIGMSAYQFAATNTDIIAAGLDLPDIPAAWLAALTAYFGLKIAQFAKEHSN